MAHSIAVNRDWKYAYNRSTPRPAPNVGTGLHFGRWCSPTLLRHCGRTVFVTESDNPMPLSPMVIDVAAACRSEKILRKILPKGTHLCV